MPERRGGIAQRLVGRRQVVEHDGALVGFVALFVEIHRRLERRACAMSIASSQRDTPQALLRAGGSQGEAALQSQGLGFEKPATSVGVALGQRYVPLEQARINPIRGSANALGCRHIGPDCLFGFRQASSFQPKVAQILVAGEDALMVFQAHTQRE